MFIEEPSLFGTLVREIDSILQAPLNQTEQENSNRETDLFDVLGELAEFITEDELQEPETSTQDAEPSTPDAELV